MLKHAQRLAVLIVAAASVFLAGCSTIINSHRQKQDMMTAFIKGDNKAAMDEINYKLRPPTAFNTSVVGSGDEIPWRLEAASLNFHTGNFKEAIAHFEIAENLIADYDERAKISVRDIGSEGLATFTNLNALPYRGLCRDRMALSIYKALAYLGIGKEDAFRAQIKRLREQQVKVQEDYRTFFEQQQKESQQVQETNSAAAGEIPDEQQLAENAQNKAFAQAVAQATLVANKGYGNFLNPTALFLSGLGLLFDGRFDNARIEFQRIYEAMPNSPLAQTFYKTALLYAERPVPAQLKDVTPFNFPLDHDCVYLIFTHGRTAAFQQSDIAFPVRTAFPVCEFYPSSFSALAATADNQTYTTLPLADMDAILAQEYKERLPGMITRIIINTLVKEATFIGSLVAANKKGNFQTQVIVFLIGMIYRAAMNTADTRSWEILPKEFQLTQFPMPKNRTISMKTQGYASMPFNVTIPQGCRSAIILIDAPSQNNIITHVFPITSK